MTSRIISQNIGLIIKDNLQVMYKNTFYGWAIWWMGENLCHMTFVMLHHTS